MDHLPPQVSVVIPVYNGENYLCEAIDSVFAQTFSSWELIVVDDGSSDHTWDLIQSFGNKLRGYHQENGGVASALNTGIRQSKGEYIAWLSHDDLFFPDKLNEQVQFLTRNPHFKACYTDYDLIDAQGKTIRSVQAPWFPPQQAIQTFFGRMYMNGSTMMIERACFSELGYFREDLKFTQDVDMWVRILRRYEIGHINKPLARHRLHVMQGSRDFRSHFAEEEMYYTRLFQELGPSNLLPELVQPGDEKVTLARAYTWFGDTTRVYRRWYAFAGQQYTRSIEVNPSFRNPAHWKRLFNLIHMSVRNMLRPVYHRLKGSFGMDAAGL